MKHPDRATLALHAGADLGAFARWRTERHLAGCDLCRRELAAYRSDRESLAELHSFPGVGWARLASEMRANIRLGLTAGECVAPPRRLPVWRPARLAAVAAGLALAAATVWIEFSGTGFTPASGVVVETTAGGVRLTRGGQAMGLLNRAGEGETVTYTAGAQGSVEARYVDTNCVTVNQVDVD